MAGSTSRRALTASASLALLVAAGVAAFAAVGTDTASQAFYGDNFAQTPSAAALTVLGRALFADVSLSASGKTACTTCHDPAWAFGPPNTLPVQRAGRSGLRFGVRAAPALTYTQNVPAFTEHYVDDDGDDSVDQGPAGGRTWDGRSLSAHDQALLPLFSPFEMANENAAALLARVAGGEQAAQFKAAFGDEIFHDVAVAMKAIRLALEVYQQSPEFYPYDSKYDAWLRGQTTLSAQEQRGLAVFNDPRRGNCTRCHPAAVRAGAFPQFTDFGYAALGVPRNPNIPANADRGYFDLGLCGPLRADLSDRAEYCGLFRTPSLRNVALRHTFFHNGAVHRLTDAVRFYAERDTRAENWYPRNAAGQVRKYDDLPARYQANIDRAPPFGTGAYRLGKADIADIVVFLETLSDGYAPPTPGNAVRAPAPSAP